MTASSPAGWYPDPSGAPGQRYYDGVAWSDVAVAAPTTAAPSPGRLTIHYGFALLALFALGGTVIPAYLLFAAASDYTQSDPSTSGMGITMGVLWLVWGGMWTLIWAAFAIHHTLRSRNP